MNSQWTEPKDFSITQLLIVGLKNYFEKGIAEYDEIPKSSFPFQPQTKKVNSSYYLIYLSNNLIDRANKEQA